MCCAESGIRLQFYADAQLADFEVSVDRQLSRQNSPLAVKFSRAVGG